MTTGGSWPRSAPTSSASEDVAWVQVSDPDGVVLGYAPRWEVEAAGIQVSVGEPARKYLDDPLIAARIEVAYAQGVLSSGRDLNRVQLVALQAAMLKRAERERDAAEARFEEMLLLIWGPKSYEDWQREKRSREESERVAEEVVWEAPTPEELAEDLKSLLAGDDEEEEEHGGWVGPLDNEDLDEMED